MIVHTFTNEFKQIVGVNVMRKCQRSMPAFATEKLRQPRIMSLPHFLR